MYKVVIIAPHPDDETLGCGGTILKHKNDGDEIYWLIVTAMTEDLGYSPERICERTIEIEKISRLYEFSSVYQCGYPTTRLDVLPISEIVNKIGNIFEEIKPDIVYLPFRGDVHTDHQIVFDAVAACTKWFRYPSIKRVLAYETLSETDLSIDIDRSFQPNYFVNIEKFFNRKIEALSIYKSELSEFPFPRSIEALHALALVRGVASGYKAAEAFMLLRERC